MRVQAIPYFFAALRLIPAFYRDPLFVIRNPARARQYLGGVFRPPMNYSQLVGYDSLAIEHDRLVPSPRSLLTVYGHFRRSRLRPEL